MCSVYISGGIVVFIAAHRSEIKYQPRIYVPSHLDAHLDLDAEVNKRSAQIYVFVRH